MCMYMKTRIKNMTSKKSRSVQFTTKLDVSNIGVLDTLFVCISRMKSIQLLLDNSYHGGIYLHNKNKCKFGTLLVNANVPVI